MRPVLVWLRLGGRDVPVPSFLVLMILGYGVGATGAAGAMVHDGWSRGAVALFFGLVVPACALGAGLMARLVDGLVNRQAGRSEHGSGAAMVGGLILGCGVAATATWRLGHDVVAMFGLCAPWIFIGTSIGRIGCFMAGCDHGHPVGTPRWPGVRYPNWAQTDPRLKRAERYGAPAFLEQWARGLVATDATHSLPCHPVPVYWAGALLVGGAALLAAPDRLMLGALPAPKALLAVWIYTLATWAIEPLRGDEDRGVIAGVDLAQWITLAATLGLTAAWGLAA